MPMLPFKSFMVDYLCYLRSYSDRTGFTLPKELVKSYLFFAFSSSFIINYTNCFINCSTKSDSSWFTFDVSLESSFE
jgi:hypothetical protein